MAARNNRENKMNSTMISLLAVGCTFGASLVGIFVRHQLPSHHLEGDSKDLVKLVMGLIATITALVLGLLISSSHSAYDTQRAELQQLGIHLYQVDRILAHFGPEAKEQRDVLRHMVAADIARVWPADGETAMTGAPLSDQAGFEGLIESVAILAPKSELQKLGQDRALQLLGSIGELRRVMVEQSQGALSRPILIVLLWWLSGLFFGFGLCARFNPTVIAALFMGSLSVAAAIFLILDMNQPYRGWMQISGAPLQQVLSQMGR